MIIDGLQGVQRLMSASHARLSTLRGAGGSRRVSYQFSIVNSQFTKCCKLWFLCWTVFFFTSCEPDVTYSRYAPLSEKGWERKDTVCFQTDTIRHEGKYGFTCGIRTRREYPYQSLALVVERCVWRDKKMVERKRERVLCPIVTKHGKVLGDGIASKQHEAELEETVLKTGDSLTVKVSHLMTKDTLPGIVDVGFIMQRR